MKNAWEKVREALSKELPSEHFVPFIRPLHFKKDASQEKDCCILEVPDQSLLEYLQSYYCKPIESRLQSLMQRNVRVEFKLFEKAETRGKAPKQIGKGRFNPEYRLNNYIKGKSNEMALLASEAVANNPGKTNPLFIYGKPGMGKTHLVHGIAQRVLDFFPDTNICLITIEDFKSDFLKSRNNKSIFEYKSKLRTFDMLVIEEVQFLPGLPEAALEEFFYLFNHYYESNRQIIVTSDQPISRLAIPGRLASRFVSGLPVRIDPPDKNLRRHYIIMKCNQLNLVLAPEVLEYLIRQISGNIRELESAINRLFFLRMKNIDYNNLESVISHFSDIVSPIPEGPLSLEHILKVICSQFNVTKDQIMGNSRKSEITRARHTAMYLAVKYSDLNKSAIARYFNKSDHSTVIHAEKSIKKRIMQDNGYKQVFQMLLVTLSQDVK